MNFEDERVQLIIHLALHKKMFSIYPETKMRRKIIVTRMALQIDADSLMFLQDKNKLADLERVLYSNKLSENGVQRAHELISQVDVVLDMSLHQINYAAACDWLENHDPSLSEKISPTRARIDFDTLFGTLVEMPQIQNSDQLWFDQVKADFLEKLKKL